MSSRRRNSKKNLGTNLSDIQRRLRRMERKPIRTRLQNRVIKGAAIAPSSITADEVEFGTTVITAENPADVIVNPKEGLLVVDPDTGEGQLYSEEEGGYVDIKDAAARAAAATAASNAATAQSNATTALANAATALTAANNSLQPSANTIVNVSNQMTAINSTGITVYSGASATSGARIVLNSTGLAGFNVGGTATFSVSATTGAAVFSGSVTSSTITASTMNINGNAIIDATGLLTATGATITGTINATAGYFGTAVDGFSISATGLVGVGSGTIVGGTITGSTIRTSASGRKVIIDGANNYIRLDDVNGTATAFITPLTVANLGDYGVFIHVGSTVDTTGVVAGAGIFIAEYATRIYAQDRTSYIDMSGGFITIQADNSLLAYVSLDNTEVIVGELTGYAKSADPTSDWKVRNIKATATTGTPSGGLAGDIMLVYT